MLCYTSDGMPVMPMSFSPGIIPFCRPAPHIVTPAPSPLPCSSSPLQHRPCGGHGLTPGPNRVCGGLVEPTNLAGAQQDYTARCMAEWQRSDV